jgi:hypothetical protein
VEVIIGPGGGCGLLGEALVLSAGGVKADLGSLGPDAQQVAGLFERGKPGIGGGVQLPRSCCASARIRPVSSVAWAWVRALLCGKIA